MNVVSIIIAGHGQLAGALMNSAEMIAGKQTGVTAVTLAPNDGIDTLDAKFKAALDSFSGKDVLILTDLWGGSPFNAAAKLVAEDIGHLALIAGVNLPLVLEAYMVKDQPLSKVVDHLNEVALTTIKQFKVPTTDNGEDLL